jgi:hypothetical protein
MVHGELFLSQQFVLIAYIHTHDVKGWVSLCGEAQANQFP